jgi:hypothetical protein
MPKDSDYTIRKTYLDQNFKQTNEKTGKESYIKYSSKNMKSKNLNPQNPKERKYGLNLNFTDELTNQYPSIKKYKKYAIPHSDNATTVISNEIIKNVWKKAKYVHKVKPEVIDISDGVNYITFKNYVLNDLLYNPIKETYKYFDNFYPKEKRDLSNEYFDHNLAGQFLQLIEKTLNILIALKTQISPNIRHEEFELSYNLIYSLFPKPQ